MDSIRQLAALSGWTAPKLYNTSKAETAPKEDHDDGLVIVSRSDPLQLPESRRNHFGKEITVPNQLCC